MRLFLRGCVVFGEGGGVSLLERKEGWQHLWGHWAVGCVVLMSLFSSGITLMFSWPFLCPSPPQHWQVQAAFFLQILSFFSLPICRKEGDQKGGWYDN